MMMMMILNIYSPLFFSCHLIITNHLTITNIVNLSFSSGTFPDQFKHSVIKPLLKKSNLDHKRLISDLPFISKLIECLVKAQLAELLSTRTSLLIWSTIPQKQCCFQSMITLFKPSAVRPSQVFACWTFLQLSIPSIILFSWIVSHIGLDLVIVFFGGLHLIFILVPFQSRRMATFLALSQFHMVSSRDSYWDHCFSCCTLLLWAIMFKIMT